MTGRRLIAIFGTVFVAVVLTGCGSKPVVGVVLPISGNASGYGESIESGMRLAINDARDTGQLPADFEVIWADSGSDPAQGIAEVRRLVHERGAKLILGAATSSEASALVDVLDDINVVCLSPSASTPGLTKRSKLFYRIYPSDELEGHTAGKFMIDRLGATETVLFVGNPEYVAGIEPEFRRQYEGSLGGKVVSTIDLRTEGWKDEVPGMLRKFHPSAVYVVGYAEEILGAIRQLRASGFKGRIVTTSAFFTSEVLKEAGKEAEGVLFPLPPFDRTVETEPVVSFVHRYMDTFERAPDVFAAHGYDAMKIAIQVFALAKPPETPEINKALHFGVTDFMGVTGPILFDDHGDVKHYPKMFIVKNGQVLGYRRYLDAERKRILRQVQNLLISEG
jgi:branched-chain amino acid transport system substrate-binding protein